MLSDISADYCLSQSETNVRPYSAVAPPDRTHRGGFHIHAAPGPGLTPLESRVRRRAITPTAGLMSADPRSTTGCHRCVGLDGPILHRLRSVQFHRPRSTTRARPAAPPPSR